MNAGSSLKHWRRYLLFAVVAGPALLNSRAHAQTITRVKGIDVSYYQGILSQDNWNTIHNVDGRDFVFIRATRGGTTGTYNPSNPSSDTLARRYDDPYFVQNITFATNAGMYAGIYHFGRPDVIASTPNSGGIANTGTDEANHMLEMAGAWMRPGYLLPIFDFEAGASERTPSQLAQFAVDFSNRIYAVKGIRPGVYIGNNYAAPMNNIPESAAIVAAYPTLWTARWPNQSNNDAVNIQGTDPADYTSTVYGPWDNPPNGADPWHFWQYGSTSRLQGIDNGHSNVDADVAHGGIEFVKDHLVPAIWLNDTSGDWSALTSWNSGEDPTPPVTGKPGQLPPTSTALPTPRLPDVNDTVVLDRPNANITLTHSTGTTNIRKLYVKEGLNITGGTLNIGYVPSADSTTFAAEFSNLVTLSGSGNLNVHTLQIDQLANFSLTGGTLTFNTITLSPDSATPGKITLQGNVNFAGLSGASAVIQSSSSLSRMGFIDLQSASRTITVADGAADTDVAINVPISNGSLIKAGLGTLALGGVYNYEGDTRVQAGRLRIVNPSLNDNAAVYLASGTTLDLKFTGNPDIVYGLYFNGVRQAEGIWGPVGSGAQYTSSYLTGTGRLLVTTIPPPPGNVIDDFEVNEGHFSWPYNYSPAAQTYGLAASTTIDRVTTQHQGTIGSGSQLLNLVASGSAAWQICHISGIGTGMAGQPAGNVQLDATGYVGFWLKTDDPGITVRIGIDDPVGGNTALERGYAQPVIPDNNWHLYQWNLENDNHWDAFSGGANGYIDAENDTVTIDSIWFTGLGNAQIYLDNVSHNPDGLLSAAKVVGDYDGNGVVDIADYAMWRSSYGNSVTPGTKADGNHDGVIDAGDYIVWRNKMSAGGGSSLGGSAAAIPEPTGILLAAMGVILIARRPRRQPLAA